MSEGGRRIDPSDWTGSSGILVVAFSRSARPQERTQARRREQAPLRMAHLREEDPSQERASPRPRSRGLGSL